MTFTNEIAEIRELQRQYVEIQKKLTPKAESLENKLNALCKDTAKEFGLQSLAYILLSFSGSHSTSWDPHYFLYYITPKLNEFFIPVNGQWVRSKGYPSSRGVYPHAIEHVKLPFDPDHIANFVRALVERSGIRVEQVPYPLLTAQTIEKAKTVDDVRLLHPECTILAQGKKLYEGWDIGDPYVIAQTKDGIHIYYATNGHGGGFDEHIKPGESIDNFMNFLEDPDRYLSQDVINQLNFCDVP